MLVEKEVIRPGVYWYRDEKTGLPRKLEVTPDLTRYWHEQGNKMLSHGLTVPVPCEHDFNAHPMSPPDKLKNNAGWVKEYRLKDDRLFSVVDVQDESIAKKLPGTIRWTSPWINSFTDGDGREWKNVISHLALTTRPRIINQEPFGSIAAALSMATETTMDALATGVRQPGAASTGACLSRAGLLKRDLDDRFRPVYPIAFSLYGGIRLGDDLPFTKKGAKTAGKPKVGPPDGGNPNDPDYDESEDDDPTDDDFDDDGMNEFADAAGDVGMEELLCDLLAALGIHLPESTNETQFKRALYEATMTKIHELAAKGQQPQSDPAHQHNQMNRNQPGKPPPGTPGAQPNPIIKQEQQPMYMSLEDIEKIADPTMKSIALSMYQENAKLRGELEANSRIAASLRDAKLKEANDKRTQRVNWLGRVSPKVKADLDAMLALPGMALSLGDGGEVIDPMAQTLTVLEKGLADMPRLLTTDQSALSVQPQPSDGELSNEVSDELADNLARRMGCPPATKAG